MTAGIYLITNVASGRVYIGRALDIVRRWRAHRSDLKAGRHKNKHLQRAWSAYGPEAFEFSVYWLLGDVPQRQVDARLHMAETEALLAFPYNYNLTYPVGGSLRQSAETRALIGAKSKELWENEDRREMAMLRMLARNEKNWADPHYRAARLADHAKRLKDPAYRAALSAGVAASWADPVIYAKKVRALLAASATPEVKARRGAGQKKRWSDPEQYAKQIALLDRIAADPEVLAKRGAHTAGLWADPEHREKRIAALRAGWAKKRAAKAAAKP